MRIMFIRSKNIRAFLLAVVALGIFSSPSFSDDNFCAGTKLWRPSENSQASIVIKWNSKVSFGLITSTQNSETAKSIRAKMSKISFLTGLSISDRSEATNQLPDIVVAVVPHVTDRTATLRLAAEKFFQAKLAGRGTFKIYDQMWDALLRDSNPKCFGADFQESGVLHAAFIIIEEGASDTCLDLGIDRSFGLTNIKRFYEENNHSVSDELVQEALKSLYSKKISPGMRRDVIDEKFIERCK